MNLVCHVILQDYMSKRSRVLMGRELLKLSHHCAKFGRHRHGYVGDIMVLVSRVMSQDHVINVSYRSPISYHTPKFDGHRHCGSGDNGFSLSGDLARPRDRSAMWLYRQKAIKVSYHLAMFGSHRHSDSVDIRVCHVILQDRLIKGLCDFMGGSPSW